MTAARKAAIHTYTVQLDDEIAEGLRRISERTGDSVEDLIASAALAYADRGFEPQNAWTAEDIAAIDEGFTQIDRGQAFTQEEVEAQIDAVLR